MCAETDQNAQEFIFDGRYYATDHLLHPSLAEFQGPSLLAYDNSTYDFESLYLTGNSLRFPHRISTGHYLDSVYNYTDCPSVLSGSTLLFFNPRLRFSTEPGLLHATYNFVQQSGRREMRNQLAAFGAVLHDPSIEFVGTIIRIPLRTEEQAAMPAVAGGAEFTTEANVLSAFSRFKRRMVESLLFLKNVVSITLRIAGDDQAYAEVQIMKHPDGADRRGSVAISLREIFTDRIRLDFNTTLLITIHFRGRGEEQSTSEWVVFHHARRRLGADDELTNWGEAQGLVPWVAIAALVRVNGVEQVEESEFSGRLFNRLSLPLHTNQPVHIHGMFFPTPDHASTPQVRDPAVRRNTDMGSRWNSTLFSECLTFAWSQFLLSMSPTSSTIGYGFQYWPRNTDRNSSPGDWASFMEIFLKLVVHTELPIWPTSQGLLRANNVLLAQEVNQQVNLFVIDSDLDIQDTMHVLEEVGMAVTYPPAEIYDDVRMCIGGAGERLLTPVTAASFLRTAPENLVRASQGTKQWLLEYLLSQSPQIGYAHLNGIELFPMCDGSFSSSGTSSIPVLMLPIDDHERDLFDLRPHMTIDVRRIRAKTLRRLRKDMERVEKETSLKQWRLEDVYKYCMATYFSDTNPYVTFDVVEAGDLCLKQSFSENLAGLWDWIISQVPKGVPNSHILTGLRDLWLIPVMGEGYRRVCPTSKQPLLDPSSREELGSFLKSVCETKECGHQTNQLYYADLVSPSTTEFFRNYNIIQSCDDFENLMSWLENRPQFVSLFCSWEREELVRFLDILSSDHLRSANAWEKPRLLEQLKRLPVFEEIRNNSRCTSLNWTTLVSPREKYVAVTMENVVPDIDGIVFLSARNPSTLRLFKNFCLAEVPDMPQLLDEYIFPGILAEKTRGILERLVAFALDNFGSFPVGGVAKMVDMEFVPVWSRTGCGVVTKTLKTPRRCVDPRSGLGNLFFPHESVWIDVEFWKAYSEMLVGMQLIDKITVELVLDRVRAYSEVPSGITADELAGKVELLITASNELGVPSLSSFIRRPWLPARKYSSGNITLANPEQCRDESFKSLVGYAMPIVPFRVGKTWCKALEWDGLLPAIAIQTQVQILVDRREFSGLGVILDYLEKNGQVEGYLDGLREMKWILGASGEVFKCEDIFFNHAVQLNPSCDCIGNELHRYKSFFSLLGVQEQPSLRRLKRLINNLDRGVTLNRSDLDLAIDSILLATNLYPNEGFSEFKAPDYTNTLRNLPTLTAGKPEYCEEELFFLHPRIPQQSINVLGVPTLDQRQLDDVEKPFGRDSHSAKSRMTAISRIMERFPAEHTFNAYLGNAENSQTATKIGWMLDRNEDWEKLSLLTECLSDAMGPALLCWSDGSLQQDYFFQLMDICKRTESSDTQSIGNFSTEYFQSNPPKSRMQPLTYVGSMLTMYHWSNLPHIISRDYFIILE